MAKTSILARESRRDKQAAKARIKRAKLREEIKKDLPFETKSALVEQLNKMPRNDSKVRTKRRCRSCGRPRGVYRKFGICRMCLRTAAMRGDVPGLVKSSW